MIKLQIDQKTYIPHPLELSDRVAQRQYEFRMHNWIMRTKISLITVFY
jgi:hypothetical protein